MALMDNIPGWKVFSAGVGIAALAVVGYFLYQWFLASPDDLKPLQRQAVEHALEELAVTYQQEVTDRGPRNVVVMAVQGDTSNAQIRSMVIDRLDDIEGITATDAPSPGLERRAGALVRSLVRDEPEEDRNPAEVFEDAAEADEVLTLRVEQLWSGADSGIFEVDVYRIARDDSDERKPVILDPERIKGLSGTGLPAEDRADPGPGFWSRTGSFLWRAIVVLAAAAIMPFLSWPLARVAFRRDSNLMNASLLLGLTALDLLVLFALAAFEVSTAAMIGAAILLPVALIWNLRVLNFIEEQ